MLREIIIDTISEIEEKAKRLFPPANDCASTDKEYWRGYNDALKDIKRILFGGKNNDRVYFQS